MIPGQVVVTGASRGIGAAIAEMFAGHDWPVAGLSRSGGVAAGTGYACDVTEESAVATTFRRVRENGPIAALINNAGIHIPASSARIDIKDYNRVMSTNATAVVVACREMYTYFRENGGGTIVNIGSFYDKIGVPENLAYCVSKAAVAAITRCLAVEWARDNIRVLNVAPGYVETDLNRSFLSQDKVRRYLSRRIPSGQIGETDEIARLVYTLVNESLTFLNGETIYIDGAQGINH